MGEWLDPYERSKHFLCNPWEAWPGMSEVVAQQRTIERQLEAEKPKL